MERHTQEGVSSLSSTVLRTTLHLLPRSSCSLPIVLPHGLLRIFIIQVWYVIPFSIGALAVRATTAATSMLGIRNSLFCIFVLSCKLCLAPLSHILNSMAHHLGGIRNMARDFQKNTTLPFNVKLFDSQ